MYSEFRDGVKYVFVFAYLYLNLAYLYLMYLIKYNSNTIFSQSWPSEFTGHENN